MNIWLASWQTDAGSNSHDYHALLKGADCALAEAACERMGTTWWPEEEPVSSEGCYWQFTRGQVWLKSLFLLDGRQGKTLSDLGVFDEWTVSGTPDAPVICDNGGSRWEDHRN